MQIDLRFWPGVGIDIRRISAMKRITMKVALGAFLIAPGAGAAGLEPEPPPAKIFAETAEQKAERLKWWTDGRFGMFIHFGLYAMPARHEWVRSVERIPNETYDAKYLPRFDPDLFDARDWARRAKAAGEGSAIYYGMIRLQIIALTYFTCGIMDVFSGSLRGMGASLGPTVICLTGVCGVRILWIYTIFRMEEFHKLNILFYSYPVSWAITVMAQFILFLHLRKKILRQYAGKSVSSA